MPFDPATKRTLYISSTVWDGIKVRSIEEKTTISEIITGLLQQFLNHPPDVIHLGRYQKRVEAVLRKERANRSVYIAEDVWKRVMQLANQNRFSITILVDDLLKRYLGMLPEEEVLTNLDMDSGRYLVVGGKTLDLGENPIRLDLDKK